MSADGIGCTPTQLTSVTQAHEMLAIFLGLHE